MSPTADTTLLLHAAGALEPADAAAVELALAAGASLRRRYQALSAGLSAGISGLPGPDAFRLPPPGLGLVADAGQAAVMGPARLRIGDHFMVRLAPRPTPDDEGVVVLRDVGQGWSVLTPGRPEEAVALSRLPVDPDGRHRVDLVARPPSGRQRWAVALVPLTDFPGSLPPLPEVEPWVALRRGLADGSVPAGVVEIELA